MGKSARHILNHKPAESVTKMGTPSATDKRMSPMFPKGKDKPKATPGGVTPSMANEPTDKGAYPSRLVKK